MSVYDNLGKEWISMAWAFKLDVKFKLSQILHPANYSALVLLNQNRLSLFITEYTTEMITPELFMLEIKYLT